MGVDLCVKFMAKKELSEDDLNEMGFQLLHRFRDILWPVTPKKDGSPSYHPWPVSKYKPYEDDDGIPLSERLYDVHTWCRWYGADGYERGPALKIYGLMRYLHAHPLIESAWFYGDSGGYEDATKATPESMEELLNHWLEVGNLPYQGYFDREKDGPECCHHQMIRYGWGGNYRAWFCAGCNKHIEERDGVQSVREEK